MTRTPLIGNTVEQIARLLEPLGEPSYRAKQIYKWIHHQKVSSFQEMSNLPKSLRQELETHFTLSTFELVRRQVAQDGTEKYLWKLQDGRMVESVYYYMRAGKRNRVTFEYVLLEGINDEVRHARELIRLLSPIRCKLNVIPCNENYLGFRPPSEEKIQRFVDVLMDAPFTVTVRKNRGEEITAACGQLAVEVSEEVKFIKI